MMTDKMKKDLALSVLFTVGVIQPVLGADCNANGIDDAQDMISGPFHLSATPKLDGLGFPESGAPLSLITGDFDGDSKTDLATESEGGAVSVFLSIGNRLFTKSDDATFTHAYLEAFTVTKDSSVVADLDGDGIIGNQ